MFQDFQSSATSLEARKRFGSSLAVALVVYGSAAAFVVAASATVRQIAEEKLTQVEFAAPPPPPPPPPPPAPEVAAPAASPRPKMKRRELKAPDELPQEKPKESDAPLVATTEGGPVDGFLDGVEGGRGSAAAAPPPPPPPPPPAALVQPVPLPGNGAPRYSAAARLSRVAGTVVVSFEVLEDGRVGNVRIISGPAELHESVLTTVATWRFKPAHRGGVPVRFRKNQAIVFRLEAS